MDYQLRLMRDADLPAIDRLLRLAYGNEHDYIVRLRRHLSLQPDGWLVAESGGALVGCGGSTIMGMVSYIGLVGVDPALQRRGIATGLMRALIAWSQEHSCSSVLLDASDKGKPLYLQLGFAIEDTVSIWRAQKTAALSETLPGAATIQPFQESDLPEIIAFDARGYGARRDHVITPFIKDNPALVRVARAHDGVMQGYLAIQAESHVVGPWLAATPDTAHALLVDALARHGSLVEVAITPDANVEAADSLRSLGFAPSRRLAHMRLGAPLPPSRRQMVYGQINLALG